MGFVWINEKSKKSEISVYRTGDQMGGRATEWANGRQNGQTGDQMGKRAE
ncbi:MAG: hypothetical protein FWG68_09185 [Defluviitaleaceae bacterium]|nr:hypothetical protein [Defluviitaleaceae bacterium]